MIFFSCLTDFSYFFLCKKSGSCRKLSEQLKNDHIETGCTFVDGFNYFQLFYFLTTAYDIGNPGPGFGKGTKMGQR